MAVIVPESEHPVLVGLLELLLLSTCNDRFMSSSNRFRIEKTNRVVISRLFINDRSSGVGASLCPFSTKSSRYFRVF